MYYFLLAALVALVSQQLNAQPKILHGPVVDAISFTTARVTWITDSSSSTEIRYGLSDSYDGTTVGGDGLTVHSWYLSGLAPGTSYHFQVCSTAAGQKACSADNVTTTLARADNSPAPPEPPRAYVDTSYPQGAFGQAFDVQPDCSNLRQIMNDLANLSGDSNHEVIIPAGTVCRGQFIFPARPRHTGWVIVRTSAVDSLPEGVRLKADETTRLATFITDSLPAISNTLPNISFYGSCSQDNLFWALNPVGMPIYACQTEQGLAPPQSVTGVSWNGNDAPVITVPGHGFATGDVVRVTGTGALTTDNVFWRITVLDENQFALEGARGRGTHTGAGTAVKMRAWRQVPYTSGNALPESCTPNEWFYQTEVPAAAAVHWCTSPGRWTNVRSVNTSTGGNFSALQFAGNAARYRFVGIEITHIPMPDPPPAGWSNRDYRQGNIGSLITTQENNSHIIFDRCDIHGLDYPSRLGVGINLDGANVAVIHSRIHKVNRWTEHPNGIDLEAFAINVSVGPGPGKIDNNYLEAIGITVFFPDATPEAYHRTPAADYEITRNYFAHPEAYFAPSPSNWSRKNYMNRHDFELKRGRRMVIEGNVFDTNWADVNQGSFLMLTPRPGPVPAAKTIQKIEDGILTVTPAAPAYQSEMLVYVRGNDNADYNGIWKVESLPAPNQVKLAGFPGGSGAGGTVSAVGSDIQISDIDFRNNIFRYGPNVLWMTGRQDWAGGSLNTKATSRIRLINNLVYGMDTGIASPTSGFQANRPGILAFAARGVEDLIIRNNTVVNYKGSSPTLLFMDTTRAGAHAGLDVRDNIFLGQRVVMTQVSGSLFGQQSLDQQWTAHPAGSWKFQNNIFCCQDPALKRNQLNAPNLWVDSEDAIGFQNAVGGNFRLLPVSSLKNLSICISDITGCLTSTPDPGADIDELEKRLSPDNPPLIMR